MDSASRLHVAMARGEPCYGGDAPFHPLDPPPEYPFRQMEHVGESLAYGLVREALALLRLDGDHFGTPRWNPLSGVIRPGQTVVVKPNFVREFHEFNPHWNDVLVTHGAVLRAVLDYAYLALEGRGRLVVADAPQDDADFDVIVRQVGLSGIQAFYRESAGFEIEVLDLRRQKDHKVDGVIVGQTSLSGDPAGYAEVDLGAASAFTEIESLCDRLYGSDYDTSEIRRHHNNGRHAYLVSRTILEADAVLLAPKLKTHKKVGLTANMKLLVGTCGNKNWVAHYRVGVPAEGGDQFAGSGLKSRLEERGVTWFKRAFPLLGPVRPLVARPLRKMGEWVFGRTDRVVRSGNWHGNDTAWRMAHDLMRVLHYADRAGRMTFERRRSLFSIVDAIIAGEGDGPLAPSPRPTGVVLAGWEPAAVDWACCHLMGFDPDRVPMIRRIPDGDPERPLLPGMLEDVRMLTVRGSAAVPSDGVEGLGQPQFKPHFGWVGHVERALEERVEA